MRTRIIIHSYPSRFSTALSATGMRLVLGLAWFIACAYLGSQLIVGAVTSHFRPVAISLPLVILIWVILFFCGRWLIGLVADRISSLLAKETGTEAERSASVLGVNVPQVETGQIVPQGMFRLEYPKVMLKVQQAKYVSISRMW